MSSYEFTGKSVKEAIARACEELNLDEYLLEVEVLEESTRGFLGIVGQRDARVRVRKRDVPPQTSKAPQYRQAEVQGNEAPARLHEEPEPSADEDLSASSAPRGRLIRPPLTRPWSGRRGLSLCKSSPKSR